MLTASRHREEDAVEAFPLFFCGKTCMIQLWISAGPQNENADSTRTQTKDQSPSGGASELATGPSAVAGQVPMFVLRLRHVREAKLMQHARPYQHATLASSQGTLRHALMACYVNCVGSSTIGSKLEPVFAHCSRLAMASSQGNMQWVERYFPDFDDRVGEDLVIIKGGVDLFEAAISSRKVFQNINAFKKARVLEEHVDKLRANSKGPWVFSYKHMVIDLQLGSPSILAGTEAGRALKRGRSTKRRHGKGEKCCCVLAFARPFAPATGVGRIDLSDGCDSRGCNSRS